MTLKGFSSILQLPLPPLSQNEMGFSTQSNALEFVDLFMPQKCSSSSHIITKDHASIPITVAEFDKVTGRFNGQLKTYAICRAIRRMSEPDDSILRLVKADGTTSKDL
ncbi:40S ribosomal protein S21-like [Fukomys damarensis]|uniref:40S ribosomal protein S21-like n=1 Tax=Fukomys damarensis TaxID=885580 RepID=UPI001455D593|nr:40S ribosomal protein S21-like [Fukomys damarensis]